MSREMVLKGEKGVWKREPGTLNRNQQSTSCFSKYHLSKWTVAQVHHNLVYKTRNGFEGRKRSLKTGTGEIQILCMLRRWRESGGRHSGVYANSESHFSLRLQSIGKWAGYLCRIWGSLQQNRGLHSELDGILYSCQMWFCVKILWDEYFEDHSGGLGRDW